jgi:ribA/ribD-fused uncharacterized protein
MKAIDSFTGDNFFLSNFYEAEVVYNGVRYKTSEHAYQAEKTLIASERQQVRDAKTPGVAKRLGKKVTMQDGWDNMKFDVMLDIVRAKFKQNPDLAQKLLETGTAHLEEGNDWGDKLWGTVDGQGKNWLGKILMVVRSELQKSVESVA